MTPQDKEEQKLAEMRAMVEQTRKDAEYAGFVADFLEEVNKQKQNEEGRTKQNSEVLDAVDYLHDSPIGQDFVAQRYQDMSKKQRNELDSLPDIDKTVYWVTQYLEYKEKHRAQDRLIWANNEWKRMKAEEKLKNSLMYRLGKGIRRLFR